EEDLSMMGPVRLSDVEVAQQNILNIARRLEKEGKLMLAGKEGGDTLV
ncbi:MAG: flagellar motor switch protein FliG, partial [Syntrophobacteraceae bacterium]|nr:flagellar motor switch protein FliG [Syntrophobacteraceae bacterium]